MSDVASGAPAAGAGRTPERAAWPQRLLGALACLASLACLVAGNRLTPDPAGYGTHRQLGMPSCGWLAATGRPCPTCGMTTAFAHACRGDLAASLRAQPMGLAGALALAGAFWVAGGIAVLGHRTGPICGKLLSPRVLWIAAGAWLASWGWVMGTWPSGG